MISITNKCDVHHNRRWMRSAERASNESGADQGNHQHEALLTLLPDIPGVYPEWKRIVAHHHVQGVKVYDARLVAFMNIYLIDGILTFNIVDFKRYGSVTALDPSSVLSS